MRERRLSLNDGRTKGLYMKFVVFLVLSLLSTTLGTYIGTLIKIEPSKPVMWGYLICSIVMIIAFKFASGGAKKALFVLFTLGEGAILSLVVSGVSSTMLYGAMGATTLIVFAFSILGLYLKRLDWLGNILYSSLFALLGLSVLSFFIHLPFLAYLGLGLFSVYVMYDVNKLKNDILDGACINDDDVMDSVMELYLDIINIFLYILQIMSDNDD